MLSRLVRPAFSASMRIQAGRRTLSTLKDKERGEEAKYFRDLENKKIAEMKANMENILKLSDDDDKKEALIELLAAKPEEPKGLIAKLGLNDWKMAVPIGVLCAIPVISNEVLMINEEFTLASMFAIFCASMYTNVGAMVGKSLDETREAVYTQLKKVDENFLSELQSTKASTEKLLTLEEDLKSMDNLIDDMTQAKAETMNAAIQHQYRDAIVKKLDALVSLEDNVAAQVRNRMVTKVRADVVNSFSTDKKSKENALNQAIDVLTKGANAKLGKDIVGESFTAAIKSYRDGYAKTPAGSDDILVKLEKEMKNIAVAPTIDDQGGNVYVIAPVVGAAKVVAAAGGKH